MSGSNNGNDHTVLKVLGSIVFVVGAAFGTYNYIMNAVDEKLKLTNNKANEALSIAKQNEKTILIRTKYVEDGQKAIERLGKVEGQVSELQYSNTNTTRRLIRLEIESAAHDKLHQK